MELTIEQALKRGVVAHKEGKLQDAERFYRTVLQSQPTHPDANHNLGVLAVHVNKVPEALPLFKIALSGNPKIEQFWLSYIDALIKEGRFKLARKVIERGKRQGVFIEKFNVVEEQLHWINQMKNIDTQRPTKKVLKGLLEDYQNGRFAEAEKLARSITKKFPNHQFAWKVLGALLRHLGRGSESINAHRKAVALSPNDAESHNNLGITLKEQGRLREAESSLRQAIASKPNYPEALSNLGITLQALGKIREAEQSYKRAIAIKPDYAEAYSNLGNTLQELGRLGEAEENYKQAIALKPNFVEAYCNLGIALGKQGRTREAEKSHKQAVSLNPNFAEAHYNLGITYKELGKLDDAIKSYSQAINLKVDYAEAHSNLGNTLKELGRLQEAEGSYKRAIASKPNYAEAHGNLGNTLQELGRFDEAEASYAQAIALSPDFVQNYYNLGNMLKKMGRLREAEESYGKAISLNPDFVEAHYNLGVTLQELGRLHEAVASYTRAILLKPDYAEAHCNLGNALKELGRLNEAEASFREAIISKPDYAEAQSNLGNTLQELGRLDEAEASYAQAILLDPTYAEAHRNLSSLKKFVSKDDQYSKMFALYLDKNISEEERCHINFGLAKAFEDLGEFENAFTHYSEGNTLRKTLLNYDINMDVELFRQLKLSYKKILETPIVLSNILNQPTPIFIVGMPRSGTTLIEQIISSHSQVEGAGELYFATKFGASLARGSSEINTESLLKFRADYLTNLQKVSNGSLIVTDKMPQNFRYIGLLTKAFPEAKIIHIKRNPAAVCWANYKQYFISEKLNYCYALDDIVYYYKLYENLMEFWQKSLKKRIYDLDYDFFTLNQEKETRRLIDYLNLAWDEKCLSPQDNSRSVATASNIQVRKKVYQGSSLQWKKYEPLLEGVFDSLLTG